MTATPDVAEIVAEAICYATGSNLADCSGSQQAVHRRQARAALSALEAAGALPAWRPIAEAPRDGTSILLYPAWSDGKGGYRSGEGKWRVSKRLARWELLMGFAIACTPTHFMPLPAAPVKP